MQLSDDEDARLIVLVACRRGEGFGSVLDERGARRPVAHHGGDVLRGHERLMAWCFAGSRLAVCKTAQWRYVSPRASSLCRKVKVPQARMSLRAVMLVKDALPTAPLPITAFQKKRVIQTERPPNSSVRAQRRRRR